MVPPEREEGRGKMEMPGSYVQHSITGMVIVVHFIFSYSAQKWQKWQKWQHS